MEKKSWLWKRKSSERSPGETESSGSISSQSERFSDDQAKEVISSRGKHIGRLKLRFKALLHLVKHDNKTRRDDVVTVSSPAKEAFKASSPNDCTKSPEVSSKASAVPEEVNDSIRSLTEKLSAALVNVSAKEDLVKQHAKVAEEAIAGITLQVWELVLNGWEKAENEVVVLKQKLETAVQQNSALEDRVTHLDGALKECVRQLRQAREEQEQKINEAVAKTTRDWETTQFELESQLLELQNKAESVKSEPPPPFGPDLLHKIEALKKENSALKLELSSQLEELQIRTIERDLSTQAAETASKQHLESIKRAAKLEAECRRLKAIGSKLSFTNDCKSPAASSIYVESFMGSQSDSGERLHVVDTDTQKMSGLEGNKGEPSCSDSWASALIAELDQFKNEKVINRNVPSSSIEIDLMDDFLEMEQLAALPDTKNENQCIESKATVKQSNDGDSSLKAELEAMIHRTTELEEKLEKIEAEKAELEIALAKSQESLEASELELRDSELELEELQRELSKANEAKQHLESQLSIMETDAETMSAKIDALGAEIEKERALSVQISADANESKQLLESQLVSIEAEARMMSAKVGSLETEVEKEKALSAQITVKCQELEEELSRTRQEAELQQTANSNVEVKIKQEDLAVAAGKLAECQKTIASLGQQLKSLATLEDFLIDTTSIPEFSRGVSLIPKSCEPW
ncbi:hypothetical protein Golob_005366, partial [Gossypium lobatum]|nr:hypothetical protein [Gossypium lobatum]